MTSHEYDPRKLQELIVYVADMSRGDRFFGKTKLNKILFYADFTAYRRLGHSITGAVYQHLPQGPCPHQLLPALEALGDDLREEFESTYVGTRTRLVPLRAAVLELFTGEEVGIVNAVLDDLRPYTAQGISDLSHATMAFRLTRDYHEIPYGTALLANAEPTADDVQWLEDVSGATLGVAAR